MFLFIPFSLFLTDTVLAEDSDENGRAFVIIQADESREKVYIVGSLIISDLHGRMELRLFRRYSDSVYFFYRDEQLNVTFMCTENCEDVNKRALEYSGVPLDCPSTATLRRRFLETVSDIGSFLRWPTGQYTLSLSDPLEKRPGSIGYRVDNSVIMWGRDPCSSDFSQAGGLYLRATPSNTKPPLVTNYFYASENTILYVFELALMAFILPVQFNVITEELRDSRTYFFVHSLTRGNVDALRQDAGNLAEALTLDEQASPGGYPPLTCKDFDNNRKNESDSGAGCSAQW
ncbi:hypothetical protein NX722_17605 [Endozoicomonas gorgoniicola]|uniref:Uncharacterized protein n=1 Tax=Endozoicomonas gorgoniicola TaxID=1234144 RepID=A0ABT3MYG2_9GAMM|nr:hypothetical protein [Endozoicomonas gorgoniicola]MCW7554403.1 hypothetical protein [Endozoicomonas gorgoniicola]